MHIISLLIIIIIIICTLQMHMLIFPWGMWYLSSTSSCVSISLYRVPHIACCWYVLSDKKASACLWHTLGLTHWGRVTHLCVSKLTIIGSDNGLSPGRRQAIIWTNAGILLIRTLGTNFSEILCEIHSLSFAKMHLKMSSATWRPFSFGLNELNARLILDLVTAKDLVFS